jgi:hypothetical protein
MIGTKSIAILAVCIAIALMIGGFVSLSEYAPQADTVTKGMTDHGCEGASSSSNTENGARPLPVNGGELLDSHAYVTSWDTNGLSEKIVMTGHVRKDSAWTSMWDIGYNQYQYKVYFPEAVQVALSDAKVSGSAVTEWDSPIILASGSGVNLLYSYGWYVLNPMIIYVQGPVVGVMTVELYVLHYWDAGKPFTNPAGQWNKMQTDQANLLSGIGLVTVPQDVVEEGTAAHMNVRTGVSHSAMSTATGGWTLQIFEPGTNPEVSNSIFTQNIADNYNGGVDWVVPVGSYKNPQNSTTPANWDNKYIVTLTNELFDQSHAWLFAIGAGMMKQIPNKPTFEIVSGDMSNGGYTQGGSITIKLTAKKNPIGYDVKDFIVSVEYIKAGGGDSTVVISDTHYTAVKEDNNTFTTTFDFVVPEAGTVSVWADSFDDHGLNSGVVKLYLGVTPIIPGPPGGKSIDWLNIGLIIGAIILVVGAILAFVPGVPEPFKTLGWILLLAGAAVLIICAFVALSPKAAAAIIKATILGG